MSLSPGRRSNELDAASRVLSAAQSYRCVECLNDAKSAPECLSARHKSFTKILRISYRKDALKFKLKRLSQSFHVS